MFEGMMRTIFKNVLDVDIPNPMPRMSWYDAMDNYGSDKPDVRFGMTIHEITDVAKGKGFSVLDEAAYIGAICVPGAAEYTRKQIDELTEWVKRPQVGAKGLIYVKVNADGSFKSSIDKFYGADDLAKLAQKAEAKPGDLMLVMSGPAEKSWRSEARKGSYFQLKGYLELLMKRYGVDLYTWESQPAPAITFRQVAESWENRHREEI
jgi:aspartyl-tRNA synthetase